MFQHIGRVFAALALICPNTTISIFVCARGTCNVFQSFHVIAPHTAGCQHVTWILGAFTNERPVTARRRFVNTRCTFRDNLLWTDIPVRVNLKDCLFNGLNICRFFANSLLRDSQSSSLDVFSPGKGKQKTQQDKSVRRFHGHYLEKLQASTIIDPFFLCSSITMRPIIFGFWSFVSQG